MRLPLFEDLARELAQVQAERPKDFDPSTLSAAQLAELERLEGHRALRRLVERNRGVLDDVGPDPAYCARWVTEIEAELEREERNRGSADLGRDTWSEDPIHAEVEREWAPLLFVVLAMALALLFVGACLAMARTFGGA